VDTTRQWCENTACADFAKTEGRNLKVHSYTDRRYYGTTCKPTFSFAKGTFFETRRTERQPLLAAMARLVERHSLRALCRLKQGKLQTVLHWLDLAGQHAAALSTHFLRGLHLTQAQSDELGSFVKKNRSTFNPRIPATEATRGYGEPSRCPVICGWSILCRMTAASRKQPPFWPQFRPEPPVGPPGLPLTNGRRMSKPASPTTAPLHLHPPNGGRADRARTLVEG